MEAEINFSIITLGAFATIVGCIILKGLAIRAKRILQKVKKSL